MLSIQNPSATKRWASVASVLLFFGVMLGAFGAHGLPKWTDPALLPKALDWWHTATLYLFVHALGLLLVSLLMGFDLCKKSVGICLVVGVLIFSGSLYLMGLGAPRWLGAITPIGGTLMMIGWGLLTWQLCRHKTHSP